MLAGLEHAAVQVVVLGHVEEIVRGAVKETALEAVMVVQAAVLEAVKAVVQEVAMGVLVVVRGIVAGNARAVVQVAAVQHVMDAVRVLDNVILHAD